MMTAAGSKRSLATWVLAGAAVLALVALGAWWWGGRGQDASADEAAALRTAAVQRTTLTAATTLAGVVGYSEPARLSLTGGIVTRLPEPGAVLGAGDVLMEVEGAPVFLLEGPMPLWRDIGPGVAGPDVVMVREALTGLGIDAGRAGEAEFDADLARGIAQLYARAGYAPPSSIREAGDARAAADEVTTAALDTLERAEAALAAARRHAPDPAEALAAEHAVNAARRQLRVARAGLRRGDEGATADAVAAAEEALALAKERRKQLQRAPDTSAEQAAVDQAREAWERAWADSEAGALDGLKAHHAVMAGALPLRVHEVLAELGEPAAGAVATWTTPVLYAYADLTETQEGLVDVGREVTVTLPDRTALAGTVAEVRGRTADDVTGAPIPARLRVELADQEAAAAAGAAAATLTIVDDTVADTLVIPVSALVALAEGGYAVERPDGTLVPVTVGLIAGGQAQVDGPELVEGEAVVLP
jgi:hypothetical protein